MAETANLGEYYLDWENFEEMDEAGVESLLEQFWQRYLVDGRREPALRTLGLSADFSQMELKRRYRQLATEHHPDKGGDPEQFISIRQAYEVLIA